LPGPLIPSPWGGPGTNGKNNPKIINNPPTNVQTCPQNDWWVSGMLGVKREEPKLIDCDSGG